MFGGLLQVSLTPATTPLPVVGFSIGTIAMWIVAVGLLLIAIWAVLAMVRSAYHKKSLVEGGINHKLTYRVTVPKFRSEAEQSQDKTTAQTQESISIAETFYSAIGGLKPQKGFRAWLHGRNDEMALEMVAQDELITFYITIPTSIREFVEQQLHAQYTDAAVDLVDDYNIFSPTGTVVGGYLKLKRPSVLPIKTYKELESDPLNAITNAMSKIPKGEGLAVQYIVRPVDDGWRKAGLSIVSKMQKGISFGDAAGGQSSWKKLAKSTVAGGEEKKDEPPRPLTAAEQKMMQGIENKISKAGLEVNIRIVSASQSAGNATAALNQVLQAYSQFNIYEFGNAFTKDVPGKKNRMVTEFIFRKFNQKYAMILNTEELASIFHLPGAATDTPNIRWMGARVAPAPPETPTSGDLHLGYNEYRGVRRDVWMNNEDRRRHFYVIGKTGSGKSWLLRYFINQDIKNGHGVCVLDPHGDLADGVLGAIPKERIDDVIYFNPSDMERPMGLNMLEAPNESMRDFAVQEMLSIFMMLFPPEMIGPMFEHSMRNFMLTLMADLENPGTLAEIPRMIADQDFQKQWIAKVKDPTVRSFWEDEMANTSDYHKSETMGYLTSKVGRFVENEMMRNIIGQGRSSFNFRQIMDEGKILLVNLSKGTTGDVNANLIGLILVSKLQMAAFGRADMPEDQRRDFFLYIDEFQNFITPSISTILSEARKYRLNMVLAHQYMGQLVKDGKSEIRDAVLGNVGTSLVARVGPEDTEVLGKVFEPVFTPYDLMNTPSYTWNAKIIAGNSELKPFTLKPGVAEKANPELAASLKEVSRLTYGRPKEIVEREIAIRSGIGLKKPAIPPLPPLSR